MGDHLLFYALGLTTGVAIGVLWDDAYETLRKEKSMTLHLKRPSWLHRPSARRLAGVGLTLGILLQLVVGGLLIYTRIQNEQFARCTARWQQQFQEAYQPRAEASAAVDRALDQIVLAVDDRDQTELQRSVARYLAVRSQQDKDRTQNPYPPLPAQLCGIPSGGSAP